jgi:periplasmic divalent cation tolerance protein
VESATSFVIVLVTAPDLKTARALAKAALSARLIACANLIPKIESHYRWRGRIESSAEVLLILKTRKSNLAALEKLVVARHPTTRRNFSFYR